MLLANLDHSQVSVNHAGPPMVAACVRESSSIEIPSIPMWVPGVLPIYKPAHWEANFVGVQNHPLLSRFLQQVLDGQQAPTLGHVFREHGVVTRLDIPSSGLV